MSDQALEWTILLLNYLLSCVSVEIIKHPKSRLLLIPRVDNTTVELICCCCCCVFHLTLLTPSKSFRRFGTGSQGDNASMKYNMFRFQLDYFIPAEFRNDGTGARGYNPAVEFLFIRISVDVFSTQL